MTEKIISNTAIPVIGISTLTDSYGNSIKGQTLSCNSGIEQNLGLKGAVDIYKQLSPFSSLDKTMLNLTSTSEIDLGDTLSPLEAKCRNLSDTSKNR